MKMHSGILSPSHLFSAALLAAALFAAPSEAAITITGGTTSTNNSNKYYSLTESGATYTVTGSGNFGIRVSVNCTIVLNNVTIASGSMSVGALNFTGARTCTVKLKGASKLTGGTGMAALTVGSSANVTIEAAEDGASLICTGGSNSAGIGGNASNDSGRIEIKSGLIEAIGSGGGAGIGGGNQGACAGNVVVRGGVVIAKGGTSGGAGIGGGCKGSMTCYGFYNFGGTVWATRGSSSGGGDIGCGYNGSAASSRPLFHVSGGSLSLVAGYRSGICAASNSTARVYSVNVGPFDAYKSVSFEGLPASYGQTTLMSDSDGYLYLWLPNGSYAFEDDDWTYAVTVSGANTSATRTAKPTTTTVTFKDWNGTTIAEYTDDIGTALTAPANPTRTGYTFTGWSPEAPSAFPEKDTTYTAQYTANQYTLTFYDEDGTTVLDTITQDCDSAVTAPSPAKAEYIFSGWSPDVPATMPPENRSFTAKWELAPYFRLVSVTPGTDGKVTVKYDSYNTDLTKGDFTLTVKDANGAVAATVTEWETAPSTEAGEQTAVWDAKDFIAGLENPADYTFTLSVGAEAEALYMVIDLSNGSVEYLPDIPEGGWSDAHKRQYLPLRRIIGDGETGVFQMGSPTTEKGRTSHEAQHAVTLTKPYYLGVFPLTTAQYNYVTGGSDLTTRYPTTQKTWVNVRGDNNWPVSTAVASDSFMGKLQSLTGNAHFDLPTEAEWEYACRAGSTSALYNGTELASATSKTDSNVAKLAIYSGSGVAQVSQVGQKAPNDLGLYDMLGDVWEWVLDRTTVNKNTGEIFSNYESGYMPDGNNSLDPVGDTGSATFYRARRGGAWNSPAYECRSAMRTNAVQTASFKDTGFRVACRDFSAKVGSQIDAENTVSATLGKRPRKGFLMIVY